MSMQHRCVIKITVNVSFGDPLDPDAIAQSLVEAVQLKGHWPIHRTAHIDEVIQLADSPMSLKDSYDWAVANATAPVRAVFSTCVDASPVCVRRPGEQ